MFETNSITHNNFGKSKVISKVINLGPDLNLFISGGSKDHNYVDFLLNKILDYSIDKISSKNTYKDFSSVLENVNSVLKTWNSNLEEVEEMNMLIGVLNEKDFIFSNIGKSSCYLVKKNNIVEITDKKDKKKEFSYISNGELEHKDIIVMSNKRLLNFLSESDLIDSYSKNIEKFNSSIQEILDEESFNKNISIISYIYKSKEKSIENKKVSFAKNIGYKILDTNFSKRIIAYFLIAKENLGNKGSITKKIGLALIIIILTVLLYNITSKTIENNTNSENIVQNEKILEEAKITLRIASENMTNKEIFKLNTDRCEKIINTLKEKKIFLEDIKLLEAKVSSLKKSIDGIETFSENEKNKLLDYKSSETIKIIGVNKKIYIIEKKSISGPIIKGKEIKKYNFEQIGDDYFIDATDLKNDIALITKKGKVVIFQKNGTFKVSDVQGQEKWQDSSTIASFASKIYLLSKEEGQIYKHQKSGNFFSKGSPYIKNKDQNDLKGIVDIAIDGGFYILKKDLSFIKFFSTPYRLESLSLNNLPDNYNIENEESEIKIKTRKDLNYVYMLLNNKIFVFKPNSRIYQNTKSLKYVGQIEGTSNKIKDFYISHDKEIIVLNKTGIYKVNFEVEDDKLIVR